MQNPEKPPETSCAYGDGRIQIPNKGVQFLDTKIVEEHHYARRVNLVRGSDIKPEPISWLWNGWLAAGKMHILGGAPGTGKTTIALSLAATVTTGGRWPDGSQSSIGNVVIWSGEDDPKDRRTTALEQPPCPQWVGSCRS